jgi:3-oxoacyl-[acyl-carrier-protein] synthase II
VNAMDTRRVVVTGCGVVSPLALDVDRHWSRLLNGESGVGPCDRPYCRTLPPHLGALVTGFERRDHIPDRMVRKLLSPNGAYPVAAANDAIRHAGLEGDTEVLNRAGLFVGSLAFDIPPDSFLPALKESFDRNGEFDMARYAQRGLKVMDPLFLVKALPNGGLCGISILHQILGSNTNITNGALSGLQAVAAAAAAIRRGEVDVAVAGGYDSQVTVDGIVEHLLSGRLSRRLDDPTHACRPFDVGRDGFAVGEGAAFVVLEAESHARARSARLYAELAAIAQTSSCELLREKGSGDGVALEQSALRVLARTGTRPEELGAIFGDGLGTPESDLVEGGVVHRLVGESEVLFTAATGALGYSGAATGVFSLVHGALALRDQVVPPLTNCEHLDPRCHVHALPSSQPGPREQVLVWQSDEGLKNASVLLRACHD